MNFDGQIVVKAPRPAVFEKLSNPRFFASCIEGVGDLQEIDPTHFTAVLETRVAYIRFKFNISVEIAESEAPHRIVAKSEGTPMGVVGRLTSTSTATLSEANGETTVAYSIDVALTGKLGSIGQPVLRSKAKELERQFAANLKAAFEPVNP
jgi:carbon monoxide dehydrogenase subunit G